MTFSLIVCIALAVYLFSKAVVHEDSIAVEEAGEDQAAQIQEIHDKVMQIFSLSGQAMMAGGVAGGSSSAGQGG